MKQNIHRPKYPAASIILPENNNEQVPQHNIML